MPEGFSYTQIQDFFSFWLKSLLERKSPAGYQEIYEVLTLGAVGTLFHIFEDDNAHLFKDDEEHQKRIDRIERIKAFENKPIGRMLSGYQLLYLGERAKTSGSYPYLYGESPPHPVLDFLKHSLIDQKSIAECLKNIHIRDKLEIIFFLQALIQNIRIDGKKIPTNHLIHLYSHLSEEAYLFSQTITNQLAISPLGYYLDRDDATFFLGLPESLSFNIMASHGLTEKTARHFGYVLSLEKRTLMTFNHVFLFINLGLFRPFTIQRKYSLPLNLMKQSCNQDETRKFIAKLYKHHNRFPLVFGRSEHCFICLLFSLQHSPEHQEDTTSDTYWYCPFDSRKEDPFDTLRAVALHLHITGDGCQTPCTHLQKGSSKTHSLSSDHKNLFPLQTFCIKKTNFTLFSLILKTRSLFYINLLLLIYIIEIFL